MQSTPLINLGDRWHVQVETEFDNRTHSMLVNRTGNDPYNRWGNNGEMSFPTAESAILFCKRSGWNYEVIYQGNRYHELKSYAENFQYKKEEVSDVEEEDIDFSRL